MHRATLNGERVVIKVQRPGLKALFDIDLKNVRALAVWLQKLDPKTDGAARDWVAIYDECSRILYQVCTPLTAQPQLRVVSSACARDTQVSSLTLHVGAVDQPCLYHTNLSILCCVLGSIFWAPAFKRLCNSAPAGKRHEAVELIKGQGPDPCNP